MTHAGVEVLLQTFTASALNRGKWLDTRPGRIIPEERAPISLDSRSRVLHSPPGRYYPYRGLDPDSTIVQTIP
jgi:hypothetical protein